MHAQIHARTKKGATTQIQKNDDDDDEGLIVMCGPQTTRAYNEIQENIFPGVCTLKVKKYEVGVLVSPIEEIFSCLLGAVLC